MGFFCDKAFDFKYLLLKLFKVYLLVIQLALKTLLEFHLICHLLLLEVLHTLLELCTLKLSFIEFVFNLGSVMLLLANLLIERLNFFKDALHSCQCHI